MTSYHSVIGSRPFEGSLFLLNVGHFETSETDYPAMRPHVPEAQGAWLHRGENIKAFINDFFHSKIAPDFLPVFWQCVWLIVVVRGEEANNSLRCNNVLVGQAYSKCHEWLQTATECWKDNVREETTYPDKTWRYAPRSLQLLKNMELCACCTIGIQNVFFFNFLVCTSQYYKTYSWAHFSNWWQSASVPFSFFRSRSIKSKFQISSLYPLSRLICETSSKNVHFIIKGIYFNNDCL